MTLLPTTLLLLLVASSEAFTVVPATTRHSQLSRATSTFRMAEDSAAASASDADIDDEPKRNPDRPELPELKGDFDWDAKFGGDEDWITQDIPGKEVLNEMELAAQVTALTKLEDEWRKERVEREYEESKKVGWVAEAEMANGRFAMFFLVTGLLTELWTGVSIPGQVEEMLRIGGVIGF